MKTIKKILLILILGTVLATGMWILPAGGLSAVGLPTGGLSVGGLSAVGLPTGGLPVGGLFAVGEAWALPAGEYPVTQEGTEVLTVLAGQNKQPHPTFTTNKDSLDTVWIFFENGQFRQFVIMDGQILMFSCGSWSEDPDGRFQIARTHKYMEGAGFQEYHSVHGYVLDAEEYVRLVEAGGEGAVLAGDAGDAVPAGDGDTVPMVEGDAVPAGDDAGRQVTAISWEMQQDGGDTVRIFYSDLIFEEYAAFEPAASGEYTSEQLEGSEDILLYKRTE